MQYLLVVMFSSSPQIKNFTCSGIRIIDIDGDKLKEEQVDDIVCCALEKIKVIDEEDYEAIMIVLMHYLHRHSF